ncbi:MAG TPA: hypothetical protein VHR72_09020 [Gemmataceae bacterium]|jgi:hypothetical protein|nr:hypothetical protein [Gemmataceae bacterium]
MVSPFDKGGADFATKLEDELRDHLTRSGIDWRLLEPPADWDAESKWRRIYGDAFTGRSQLRRTAKAEHEYSLQRCNHYLIVPFTSNVPGTPMAVNRRRIDAYECFGELASLGQFCDLEFFVSPLDLNWTMVDTHEDHVYGSPYFVRREWVR